MKPISHKLGRHAEFPSGSITMNIKANSQGYRENWRQAEQAKDRGRTMKNEGQRERADKGKR